MKRFHLICILLTCFSSSFADDLYVPSFDYPKIQTAINEAGSGDTVIVLPGRYKENINFLGKAITVTSTNPNDPNVVAATIIDGNEPVDANFASVVTFNSGEDNNSVLTGFTITGGTGTWLIVSWSYKGLRWNLCGGGVVCYNMSAPKITKNIFINNTARQGGGIYIYGDPVNPNDPSNPPIHLSPIIEGNTFVNNVAVTDPNFLPPDTNYPCNDYGDGGAIVCFQGCNPIIKENLIQENTAAYYGGGLHFRQWCDGLIENNLIIKNKSLLGAGIHITYNSSPTVTSNTIYNNIAGLWGGGGLYIFKKSEPMVEYNTIINNSSPLGSALGIFAESTPTVRNNLIIKNSDGSCIYIQQSTPELYHNTIADNLVPPQDAVIKCKFDSCPNVKNNIIASNGNSFAISLDSTSSAALSYNNIWENKSGIYNAENPAGIDLEANISADPKFKNADSNDYHLNYTSKCINAGDPNFCCEPETDFDDQPRKMGTFIDIGADEAMPVWNVTAGKQYLTIQEAIDDANENNTIIVTKSRYFENIDFKGKAITLASVDPNDWSIVDKTIIDGNNSPENFGTTVTFTSGEDSNSLLAGFTITGGYHPSDAPSAGYGGGIKCHNYSSPSIYHNKIISNYADKGAGISLYHSSVILKNNLISCNTGLEYSLAGGISIIDCEAPLIINNIIVGNKAFTASGILLIHSHATIINNTIAHNKSWSNYPVNGIYIESFDDIIRNCIFWNEGDDIWQTVGASEVKYCCVEDGDQQEGNIDEDPNFVNPGSWEDSGTADDETDDIFTMGNYHIFPYSPCIDIGDNNSIPALLQTEIDCEERVFNGIVDIGADEVVTNPYDLNVDGIVDYYELNLLTGEWLTTGPDLQTDFYDDDYIDFLDLNALAEHWLWQGGWYQ